jgi:hypothetical protein
LFAFLVEDASFTELDGSQKIKNKQILSVIFALLPSADIFLQQQILQDFNVLLSISEEARECFLSQWYRPLRSFAPSDASTHREISVRGQQGLAKVDDQRADSSGHSL